MTQTPLLELLLGESPYSVDLIQGNGSKPFVSISGAKKGSRHKGGGIIIADLRSLDCILGLIGVIGSLAIPTQPAEEQVAFYTERTRFLSGETKLFNDQWFYRIKVYRNFFKDVETGTYVPLKGHGLRPEGRRLFIQEMDFPINEAGREFVAKFIAQVYGAIKEAIQCSSTNDEDDVVELTRQLEDVGRRRPSVDYERPPNEGDSPNRTVVRYGMPMSDGRSPH